MPFDKRKHQMTSTTSQPGAAIPPDDANRKLTVADPDDPKLRHVSVAGGTYTILDGEIELTFRGEVQRASTGSTVNIPANAPHSFKNMSDKPARLLCMCTPAGQEEFFIAVGDPVDSRTAPPPQLSKAEQAERIQRAKALSAKYRTELLV